MTKIYGNFSEAIDAIRTTMARQSNIVEGSHWQSIDVSKKPEMVTMELMGVNFKVPSKENLDYLRKEIKPNLPWADDHFKERVSGQPLNPGEQWKYWPWGNSADKFRDDNGQFSHSYMERYWPKLAGLPENLHRQDLWMRGIRFAYGDLNNVVDLLAREPYTRQAYLPVWFPEDTGVAHGQRVPCSLGYLFMMRNNYLHVTYDIRSCDIIRHFQDDIYLTARLQLWMLDMLRNHEQGERWETVYPGFFEMHIGSLHCFKNDFAKHFSGGEYRDQKLP